MHPDSALGNNPIIWSATPTPFLEDGALDVPSLERLVEQHLGLGVTGLFLAGSCGEGPLMPNDQRLQLVRETRRLAGNRLALSVQVSDTSAARVRENILQAQEAGADYVIIAPPWIPRFINPGFARRYFTEPLEAAEVPVGLYLLPTPPECGLDLALWQELASDPRVQVIKDSTCSDDFLRGMMEVKTRRPELRIMVGYEFNVIPAAQAGYDGVVLGTGILVGGIIRRAWEAFASGDPTTAKSWQDRACAFMYDLFRPDLSAWLGGLKYALVREGLFSTEFMHPDYPITDEDRARIDAALEREREFIRPVG